MKTLMLSLIMSGTLIAANTFAATTGTIRNIKQRNIQPFFNGYTGTFVLWDQKTGEKFIYNPKQAQKPLSPCSTFKIFNSLVGLETGVLTGKDHPMKWDGTKYELDSWNADQTLQSAITNSVVWYFQRVAADIGQERMDKYIKLVHYGNEDTSGGITKFWLNTSLKISANQQADFLNRLTKNELPFSSKTVQTVEDITKLDSTADGTLHGKTGSWSDDNKHGTLGWFVGYVDTPNDRYIVATNIEGKDKASGRKAKQITKAILHNLQLL